VTGEPIRPQPRLPGEHRDCPKCGGTGKIPKTSWFAGKAQHIFDIGYASSRRQGPWGYGIYVCHRCQVERTKGKNGRVLYLVNGEWIAAVGCKPRTP